DQAVSGIPVHRFRYFPRRWERLTHEEAAPDRMKRSLLYRLMPACFVVAGMIAVWRLCRRQRYDVIHVHWPFPLALFGWAAQRARPAALVTTFYGVELRWVKTAMPFLRGFLKWAARRSDRVVAISSYTADEVRELAPVPIEVIPYTTSLPPPARRADQRAAGAPFTVLFVGRLVERKGVSHLVDAVSLLLPRVDVRLVIVGDGPERARIEARIREKRLDGRVAVRGRVSEAELQDGDAGRGAGAAGPCPRTVRELGGRGISSAPGAVQLGGDYAALGGGLRRGGSAPGLAASRPSVSTARPVRRTPQRADLFAYPREHLAHEPEAEQHQAGQHQQQHEVQKRPVALLVRVAFDQRVDGDQETEEDEHGAGDAEEQRSEERRVGKECRSRWSTWQEKKKKREGMYDIETIE